MTSRACRLGPFERLPPVMGDTLSFGGADAPGREESEARRAVDAPIIIVDKDDRQASVVHARPLSIAKRGRTFFFGKPRHQPVREDERAGRVEVDSVSANDGAVAKVDDDADTWVTLIGAPASLYGDVVYEALTSPWAEGASSSIGLLLRGRLDQTPAGSATLFGDWTGPGASVAAELSKKDFGDEAASRIHASAPAPPSPLAPATVSAVAPASAPMRLRARSDSPDPVLAQRRRATEKPPASASDDDIFFFTDDK